MSAEIGTSVKCGSVDVERKDPKTDPAVTAFLGLLRGPDASSPSAAGVSDPMDDNGEERERIAADEASARWPSHNSRTDPPVATQVSSPPAAGPSYTRPQQLHGS